jgi:O-methyltransferase involved in polyketide biosynthesis
VRHSDIAIDAQWNPIQSGAADTMLARTMTIDDASLKAIGATVATAVAAALTKKA